MLYFAQGQTACRGIILFPANNIPWHMIQTANAGPSPAINPTSHHHLLTGHLSSGR